MVHKTQWSHIPSARVLWRLRQSTGILHQKINNLEVTSQREPCLLKRGNKMNTSNKLRATLHLSLVSAKAVTCRYVPLEHRTPDKFG